MKEGADSTTADQAAAERPTEPKKELARDRTEWAYERSLLANDRTFSAWIRTGLATIAVGFGVTRLLQEVEPAWLVLSIGALFVVVGGGILLMGYWSHRRMLRWLSEDRHLAETRSRKVVGWIVGVITVALILGAGASLWLIT